MGWGTRSERRWSQIFEASNYVISAWINEELAGFARVVDDGTMCMVYDVAVHPQHQGAGIGGELMKHITHYINQQDFHSVGLFAWDKNPKNIEFYSKHGFKQVSFGMKFYTQ